MEQNHEPIGDSRMGPRANFALIVFLIIAAVFLVAEHRAHLVEWVPYWPYLLLLACPMLHLFMHRGHGHGETKK